MKKACILLIGVLVGYGISWAQKDVNYRDRTLIKALRKDGVTDMSLVKEIEIADTTLSVPVSGKFFLIDSSESNRYRYIYVGRVNSCRAGGCSAPQLVSENGHSEYFDYYILFDEKKSVRAVKVFNYNATHGHEVTAKGWLKQFIGHNGTKRLRVDKNIDAISGATISVYAITADIENRTKLLRGI